MVWTLHLYCRGHGFYPWLGTKISHAVWPKKKEFPPLQRWTTNHSRVSNIGDLATCRNPSRFHIMLELVQVS